MKKFMNIFLVCCMALTLASCTVDNTGDTQPQPSLETPTPTEIKGVTASISPTETGLLNSKVPDALKPNFGGKIAIISNSSGQNQEYDSARLVVRKYGEDKIIHVTWPNDFLTEQEQMINIVTELGADSDIKVIIANRATWGSNAAFEKLRETRKDILVLYIESDEDSAYSNQIANIILNVDVLDMGPAMVRQAQKLGAKTFVHYSDSSNMRLSFVSTRRDLIRAECEKLSIEYVNATTPDTGHIDLAVIQQFIFDDVLEMVAKYGKDTAFFNTSCSLQVPLIKALVDSGGIYPQPCCPSTFNGVIWALDLARYIDVSSNMQLSDKDIISKVRETLAKKNMLGRISTWPNLSSDVLTMASAEYAIKWINGEVPKEGVDVEVLKQLMENYAGVEVYLTPYIDEYPYTDEGTGETYDNFFMMRMDYLTFE